MDYLEHLKRYGDLIEKKHCEVFPFSSNYAKVWFNFIGNKLSETEDTPFDIIFTDNLSDEKDQNIFLEARDHLNEYHYSIFESFVILKEALDNLVNQNSDAFEHRKDWNNFYFYLGRVIELEKRIWILLGELNKPKLKSKEYLDRLGSDKALEIYNNLLNNTDNRVQIAHFQGHKFIREDQGLQIPVNTGRRKTWKSQLKEKEHKETSLVAQEDYNDVLVAVNELEIYLFKAFDEIYKSYGAIVINEFKEKDVVIVSNGKSHGSSVTNNSSGASITNSSTTIDFSNE